MIFQTLELPQYFELQVMSSKETKFNPGSGKTPGWRNKLGAVQRGDHFEDDDHDGIDHDHFDLDQNELPALHINHIGTFSNFEGVREAFETNAASRPWMQLDMGKEVTVRKVGVTLIVIDIRKHNNHFLSKQVWFESGACTACDGSSGDITGQDCEVNRLQEVVLFLSKNLP